MTSENGNLNRKGKSDVRFVFYPPSKAMKSTPMKSFRLARSRYLETLVKFAAVAFSVFYLEVELET